MTKSEYLTQLVTDNQSTGDKAKLYADVIDCTDIALSQMPESFEVDPTIGLDTLYKVIEDVGKKAASHCVGPFEAAELIAKKLGATYERARYRYEPKNKIVKLEDLF